MLRLTHTVPFALVASLSPAFAFQAQPFDQQAFEAAQSEGKPILIEVHAPWCPVCRAQGNVLAALTANDAYPDLMVFRIDFDSQESLWRSFGAQRQSTLIAFRGEHETGRLAYQTGESEIRALLETTRN